MFQTRLTLTGVKQTIIPNIRKVVAVSTDILLKQTLFRFKVTTLKYQLRLPTTIFYVIEIIFIRTISNED